MLGNISHTANQIIPWRASHADPPGEGPLLVPGVQGEAVGQGLLYCNPWAANTAAASINLSLL